MITAFNYMPQHWFQNWFNSPFYHILYQQRNIEEAERFINNLIGYLNLTPNARLLDIACGRGRHAVYLNKRGFEVTGIDLSIANIAFARQFENEKLHFFVHDMRRLFYNNYFDVAINLFTSFGYFEEEEEHLKALLSFHAAIKPGGLLVLDYFNSNKVIKNILHTDTKTIGDITFHLEKTITGDRVIKLIDFDDETHYHFNESVRLFTFDEFGQLFRAAGFSVKACFGSYKLDAYDPENADRLIFICQKS